MSTIKSLATTPLRSRVRGCSGMAATPREVYPTDGVGHNSGTRLPGRA